MSKSFVIEGKIPKKLNDLFYNAFNVTLNSLNVDCDIVIDISFVNAKKIRKLNREFRSIDKVTDVLSFPYDDEHLKGSIAICLKKAKKQAKEYNHSFIREATYLFVHALLHLFNFDHINSEDKLIMRKKEEEIMSILNLKVINKEENR